MFLPGKCLLFLLVASLLRVILGERHISLSAYHSCIVSSDQSIACLGNNTLGQATFQAGPYQGVSIGDTFSCGLSYSNSSILCWGSLKGVVSSSRAVGVGPGGGLALQFLDLSAGTSHVCGLIPNGTVLCFGDMVSPPGNVGYEAISSGAGFTCGVLRNGGGVSCWGTPGLQVLSPLLWPKDTTFVEVAAGAAHACALRRDGSVACWGDDSGMAVSAAPATSLGGGFQWLSSGVNFTCGIQNLTSAANASTVSCWGVGAPAYPSTMAGAAELSCWSADCVCVLQSGAVPARTLAQNGTLTNVSFCAAPPPSANWLLGAKLDSCAALAVWRMLAVNSCSLKNTSAIFLTGGVFRVPPAGLTRSASNAGLGPFGAFLIGLHSVFSPITSLDLRGLSPPLIELPVGSFADTSFSTLTSLWLQTTAPLRLYNGSFTGLSSVTAINSGSVGILNFTSSGTYVDGSGNWSWAALWGLSSGSITQLLLERCAINNFSPIPGAGGSVLPSVISQFTVVSFKNNPVQDIAANLFSGFSAVTTLGIPSGTLRLRSYSFSGLTRLVTLNSALTSTVNTLNFAKNSISSIPYGAFQGVSAASSLVLPPGPLQLEVGSFLGLSNISSISSTVAGVLNFTFSGAYWGSPKNWTWDVLSGLTSPSISQFWMDWNSISSIFTGTSGSGLASLCAVGGGPCQRFTTVSLQFNSLSYLDASVWAAFTGLVSLALDRNVGSMFVAANTLTSTAQPVLSSVTLAGTNISCPTASGYITVANTVLAGGSIPSCVFILSSTPSISPSIFPTVSMTPSVTATTTVSPSLTSSVSLSATISATLTPSLSATPSRTPSLTPSPTPAMTVYNASLALLAYNAVAASAVYAPPLNVTLTMMGTAMRALCLDTVGGPLTAWSPVPFLSAPAPVLCTDTLIIANYSDAAAAALGARDLTRMLWTGASFTAFIGGRAVATMIAPITPPTSLSATVFAWHDRLVMKGVLLGAVNATGARLRCFNASLAACTLVPALPCVNLTVVDASTLACRIRYFSSAWIAANVALSIELYVNGASPGGGGPTPPPLYNWTAINTPLFTLSGPSPLAASALGLLPQVGGGKVGVLLPFSAWTPAEIASAGLTTVVAGGKGAAPVFSLWVNNVSSASPCTLDTTDPLLLQCTTPAGHGLNVTMMVSFGELANFSIACSKTGGSTPAAGGGGGGGGGGTSSGSDQGGTTTTTTAINLSPTPAPLLHYMPAATGEQCSYAPPVPISAAPSWVQIPTSAVYTSSYGDDLAFNVTFSTGSASPAFIMRDLQEMGSVAVDGQLCDQLTNATGEPDGLVEYHLPATITCDNWSAEFFSVDLQQYYPANYAALDTLPLNISFEWAGEVLGPYNLGTVVLRPTITKLSPQIISSGSVFVIFGRNFCDPVTGCDPTRTADMKVYVGHRPCTQFSVITDTTITCTSPGVLTSDPTYPRYNVSVVSEMGAVSAYRTVASQITYLISGTVSNASVLPFHFIPSDSATKVSLDQPISVLLYPPFSTTPYNGSYTCALSSSTVGVLVLPITLSDLSSVASDRSTGIVHFGSIAIMAFFNASNPLRGVSVTLVVSCSCDFNLCNMASIQSLTFNVVSYALNAALCDPIQVSAESQSALAPFSVALSIPDYPTEQEQGAVNGGGGGGGGVTACNASTRLWSPAAPELPSAKIICTLTATGVAGVSNATTEGGGSGGTQALTATANVQGGTATVNPISGAAIFTGVSIGGGVRQEHNLSISCMIGSIQIPPALSLAIYITGCAAGTQPSAVGTTCTPCLSGQYSVGGASICLPCPLSGVKCDGGTLTLLPGYYRPPSEADKPLTDASQLLPCYFPDGCLLNTSTMAYTCARGYTGPLCSICNAALDYSRQGDACVPCLSQGSNVSILGIAIALLLLGLSGYVVRKSEQEAAAAAVVAAATTAAAAASSAEEEGGEAFPLGKAAADKSVAAIEAAEVAAENSTKSSISLRILLTHTQMLSALAVLKTSGTAIFQQYMAWTNVFGSAVLTQGPSQCLLRPSFTASFFTILTLPFIAVAIAVFIMLAAVVLRELLHSVRREEDTLPEKSASEAGKGPVEKERGGIGASPARPPPNSPTPTPTPAPPHTLWSKMRAGMSAKLDAGRHIAILVFIVNLAYMPIVSACLRVFNCTAAIAGVRYLVEDMRVECAGGSYLAVEIVAGTVLLLLGLGYPIFIFRLLYTAAEERLDSPKFRSTWGFLYNGYKSRKWGRADEEGEEGGGRGGGGGTSRILLVSKLPFATAENAAASHDAASTTMMMMNPLSPRAPLSPSSVRSVSDTEGGSSKSLASPRRSRNLNRSPNKRSALLRRLKQIQGTLVWWEATALLRKAGIVLIANLILDASLQIAAALVWIAIFCVAHFRLLPYRSTIFNGTEAMSLLTVLFTAIFCSVATGNDGSLKALVATYAMLVINFMAISFLCLMFLRFGFYRTVVRLLDRPSLKPVKRLLRCGREEAPDAPSSDGRALEASSQRGVEPFHVINPISKCAKIGGSKPSEETAVVESSDDRGETKQIPRKSLAFSPTTVTNAATSPWDLDDEDLGGSDSTNIASGDSKAHHAPPHAEILFVNAAAASIDVEDEPILEVPRPSTGPVPSPASRAPQLSLGEALSDEDINEL